MLSKTEYKILELMFNDLTKKYSILELAKTLELPYPQIHRTATSLIEKKLLLSTRTGKTILLRTKTEVCKEYISIELVRRDKILQKYRNLAIVLDDIEKITPSQYICLVFGSYAKNKATKESDIDLLFVIPDEYEYKTFERKIKTALIVPKTDINITTERGLLEMWQKPGQLNVGNELLKGHIILKGAEAFLSLRRKYYAG